MTKSDLNKKLIRTEDIVNMCSHPEFYNENYSFDGELWKDIDRDGLIGRYEISSFGRVKSHNSNTKKPKIIKVHKHKDGYLKLMLNTVDGFKNIVIHRLVAIAFIENSENKKEVNHKDFNKLNNKLSNLEWVTPSENCKHSFKCGNIKTLTHIKKGQILSTKRCREIKQLTLSGDLISKYPTISEASRQTKFPSRAIWAAINKKNHCNNNIYKEFQWIPSN